MCPIYSASCFCFVPVLGVALLAGCGGSASETTPVSGAVQYDGVPLKSGNIKLYPTGSTKSNRVGGQIVDGRYHLKGKQAAKAGSYRAEILSYRNRDGSDRPIDPHDAEVDVIQFIPAKYNKQSTLTLEIESTAEPIKKDFVLKK